MIDQAYQRTKLLAAKSLSALSLHKPVNHVEVWMMDRGFRAIGERLMAAWRFLTEPPEPVKEPEMRRRARFLSSILVVTIPLAMAGNVVSSYLAAKNSPISPFQFPAFKVITGICVFLSIAYGLGRTQKYYTAGAVLALVAAAVGSVVTAVLVPTDVDTLLVFLSTVVLLASLLLSLRGTVVLAILGTGAVLLAPALSASLPFSAVYNVLIFVVIMSVLIIVSAAVHQENLDRIEEQSRRTNELYEQAELHASEMQRVKNRVESILNSVGDGLVVISPDGYIQQTNPAFEQQTGYTVDALERRHYRDFMLTSQISPVVKEDAKEAMHAGRPWFGEATIRRKDGSMYDAAVTIAPVRSGNGEVVSFTCSLRDISALKELDRMKDAFVSNVSHELRTPITSLKIYFDLLDMAEPQERGPLINTLRRETERLHLIIEDVLRLSRLDQDKGDLQLKPVNLNTLVDEYVTDRIPLAKSKGLELSLEQEPDLPPLQADEGLLGQVLGILLTNALNYTPEGGQVVVRTHSQRQGNGTQWSGFSVDDTGPGIPADELDQLFDRFFRGKAARALGTPGTGLGLAIAQEIVARHAGRIEVKSGDVPGGGSSFTTWLPSGEKTVDG